MEMIRSPQNQWIKRVRKALLRHDDEIVIEGPKMVADAINRGWAPLVILENADQETRHENSIQVESRLFKQLAATETTQGVIALFERPRVAFEEMLRRAPRRLVGLDGIQDPGNVGTIIRSAAAFELSGVLCLSGTADPWSPKVIRASAGAVLSIPVESVSIEAFVELCKTHQLSIYGADAGGGQNGLPLDEDLALIFGSEGQGLSRQLSHLSKPVTIPISERIESLNVAAAAAILLSRLYPHKQR